MHHSNRTGEEIYSFASPRDYLKKVLADGKKKGQRLASIAKTAGFKSPSLLSMFINGKRQLSAGAAEKLADALDLKGKRRSYFLAMGRHQRARSVAEKNHAYEEMLKLSTRNETTLLRLQQYRFLSVWYYPVLYVMSGMREMVWDAKWIASRLGRGITPEQVKIALADLIKLGFLLYEGGRFQRLISHPMTAEDVQSSAVFRYHQQMSSLAQEALELPLADREMNGLTVAIPKHELPAIKERIRKFRSELNDYLSPMESESDQVYQLNLQLFPLTMPSAGRGDEKK